MQLFSLVAEDLLHLGVVAADDPVAHQEDPDVGGFEDGALFAVRPLELGGADVYHHLQVAPVIFQLLLAYELLGDVAPHRGDEGLPLEGDEP